MPPKQTRQPRWNALSKVLLLAAGLLIVEHALHLSPAGHKLVLLAVVMLVYSILWGWVNANAPELEGVGSTRPAAARRRSARPAPREIAPSTPPDLEPARTLYPRDMPDTPTRFQARRG